MCISDAHTSPPDQQLFHDKVKVHKEVVLNVSLGKREVFKKARTLSNCFRILPVGIIFQLGELRIRNSQEVSRNGLHHNSQGIRVLLQNIISENDMFYRLQALMEIVDKSVPQVQSCCVAKKWYKEELSQRSQLNEGCDEVLQCFTIFRFEDWHNLGVLRLHHEKDGKVECLWTMLPEECNSVSVRLGQGIGKGSSEEWRDPRQEPLGQKIGLGSLTDADFNLFAVYETMLH